MTIKSILVGKKFEKCKEEKCIFPVILGPIGPQSALGNSTSYPHLNPK